MTPRRDRQGRLVPLCEIEDCVVAAIGLDRCVQHIAPLMAELRQENAPAVEEPGRSEIPPDAGSAYAIF